jgi:hypothetical protein
VKEASVFAAILSIVLGVLGLSTVVWFPTAAIVLGLAAVLVAWLERRRLRVGIADADRWTSKLAFAGLATGVVAVVGSVLVVVLTTT